ncbi:hypothetical protein CfE428DRAFT_5836 [Chthoniobacter flavus Ellin428]|uniref:Uncharacterized protein n=1 Tax=Chthoniobacter flavus Ellin428 TaxID=497964 RepID=B4DA96_9BACT|nr:hypothetical protein [Chthoniobacter flavus]EDY16723.1 hypothetical protein CfE428DRAFT_5836 [Chthoniobacter flavus Ellin428]TCO87288.1 hypothetical protein EV701_123125 [Chthoniobacter flavus]
MSFSRRQQPEFRVLVPLAWVAHCRREGLARTLKVDRDWYERELCVATGQASTKECNAGRDYDLAMAHFEGLAGVGIKWQMRVYSGDVTRMMHCLRSELGAAALRTAGVDERYVLAALKQGFGTREAWRVSREDLIVIVGEVKRCVRRAVKHGVRIADEKAEALGLWQEGGVWGERPKQEAVEEPEVPF